MSDGVYLWFLLQNEITITAQQYVNLIQVAIAQGFHLFPFRTEKLSLVTPMVPVTVVEYVINDLKEDELAFHNPLHRRILSEADRKSVV